MGKRILVVDDEERLASLLKDYLTQEGYWVIVADDGGPAHFQTHHEDPDLNILDIVMLEMDIEEDLPDVEVDRDRTV